MHDRLTDLHRIVLGALVEADALHDHPERQRYSSAELWDVGIGLNTARLALRSLLGFPAETEDQDGAVARIGRTASADVAAAVVRALRAPR